MEGRDRLADTMLRDEMRRLNAHLPRKRLSISELLTLETPWVPSADGGKIVMKKAELESLAKSLPEDLLSRVKLPLVLLRRTELGIGAFVLLGDRVEEYALFKMVAGSNITMEEFRDQTSPYIFYKPQVSELLRRFHSLIVIGFGVSDELNK
jgi:uncharacterized protein (UPF0216 family)